jgi:hypothetical protein
MRTAAFCRNVAGPRHTGGPRPHFVTAGPACDSFRRPRIRRTHRHVRRLPPARNRPRRGSVPCRRNRPVGGQGVPAACNTHDRPWHAPLSTRTRRQPSTQRLHQRRGHQCSWQRHLLTAADLEGRPRLHRTARTGSAVLHHRRQTLRKTRVAAQPDTAGHPLAPKRRVTEAQVGDPASGPPWRRSPGGPTGWWTAARSPLGYVLRVIVRTWPPPGEHPRRAPR